MPKHLPKTSSAWYQLGLKMITHVCGQVGCGREPNAFNCKKCHLLTLSDNIDQQYHMNNILVLRHYVIQLKEEVDDVIYKTKVSLNMKVEPRISVNTDE
jgi:hypothetical protein